MEPVTLLVIGTIALIALSNNSGATTNLHPTLTKGQLQQTVVRPLLQNHVPTPVYALPPDDLANVTSFANCAYVEHAINDLGYDLQQISNDIINQLVTWLSTYQWDNMLRAIGYSTKDGIDTSLLLSDDVAYSYIDDRLSTVWGLKKVAGVSGIGDTTKVVSDVVSLVPVVGGWISDAINAVSDAWNWVKTNFPNWFDNPDYDSVGSWLVTQGVPASSAKNATGGDVTANAAAITSWLKQGDFWNAGADMTWFLQTNPNSALSAFNPVYCV